MQSGSIVLDGSVLGARRASRKRVVAHRLARAHTHTRRQFDFGSWLGADGQERSRRRGALAVQRVARCADDNRAQYWAGSPAKFVRQVTSDDTEGSARRRRRPVFLFWSSDALAVAVPQARRRVAKVCSSWPSSTTKSTARLASSVTSTSSAGGCGRCSLSVRRRVVTLARAACKLRRRLQPEILSAK